MKTNKIPTYEFKKIRKISKYFIRKKAKVYFYKDQYCCDPIILNKATAMDVIYNNKIFSFELNKLPSFRNLQRLLNLPYEHSKKTQ